MTFVKNFKRITWGYVEVCANSTDEAQKQFVNGNYKEYDNKTEYEYDEWEVM